MSEFLFGAIVSSVLLLAVAAMVYVNSFDIRAWRRIDWILVPLCLLFITVVIFLLCLFLDLTLSLATVLVCLAIVAVLIVGVLILVLGGL